MGQASHLLSWLLQIRDSVYQLLRSCHFTQSERPKWPTTSTVDILCYLEWVPEIIQSSPATIFYQTCCNSFEILEIFILSSVGNLNLEREDLSSQSKLCHRSSCWVGPTMLLQSWLEYVFPDKIIEDPKAQRINRIRWCLFPIQETIARCFENYHPWLLANRVMTFPTVLIPKRKRSGRGKQLTMRFQCEAKNRAW